MDAFLLGHGVYYKSTKASPKILLDLLAKYWVTKSIFSPVVSQKPKNRSFLPVCFDLELTPFLEICTTRNLSAGIKQHV